MAFSNLFRRYSTSNEMQTASFAYMDENSIAETLLEELESQCQNCLTILSLKTKQNSPTSSSNSLAPPPSTMPKRHSSVDYSWLTPNKNLLQTSNEIYHLSDIIKMELSELIRNVLPEDCTWIINQFRRHIRTQTKVSSPENIIALFRATISDYIEQKPKNRTNSIDANAKSTGKSSTMLSSFVRNNRINPKHPLDDEQHCIAELTEISISSSSNDGPESSNHSKLPLNGRT